MPACSERVNIRLRPAERRVLDALAAARAISRTDVLRSLLLQTPTPPARRQVSVDARQIGSTPRQEEVAA